MLKKRLIFTLLYNDGQFMLSRNFRLQKVGNITWLKINYDFTHISFSIDELIVLDVTRGNRNIDNFCDALKVLAVGCFAPIAAGGGIRDKEHARALLRSGADKVVVNAPLFEDIELIKSLASEFGQQCIVASIDLKSDTSSDYGILVDNGSRRLESSATEWLKKIAGYPVGEIYLNSVDRDGTGQGYDLNMLNQLPANVPMPVILAGGAGNANHLAEGLADPRADAVATAHLFNFVGDGLVLARRALIQDGFDLPVWDIGLLGKAV